MNRRHIPGEDIRTLGDISFAPALTEALLPQTDYDVDRWLFVPCRYEEYRYLLGTRGARPLICLGINPSTARPDALDPTLQSAQRITLNNGYDAFIMLNVYAQRATRPEDMERTFNPALHRENLAALDYALSLQPSPVIWAAWGTLIEKRPYLWDCLRDIARLAQARGAAWVCCGRRSKAGHPHHPLYLRKDEPLVPFDLQDYLRAR